MISIAQPQIGREEIAAVERVLASGALAQGHEVAAFEEEFSSAAVAGLTCIAVNSGTSALHLALLAAGIGSGDEVVVPSFTFAATANAVALTGAKPVFADIEPNYFTLNPAHVENLISSRTRAVIPVHLYGHPADMVSISALCKKHGLLLLEDAAQAHLATLGGRPVGTWGTIAAFSFYPTKNMTSGEGGMVSTSDAELARRVRLLRNQGQEKRYENEIVGLNNRMTDIHAAIGRVQLRKVVQWTLDRRRNATFLNENLNGVRIPSEANDAFHVYHQYTVRIPSVNRDKFAAELNRIGIGTGVYYPIPLHRLPAFEASDALPETERAARECLSLPVHPSLKHEDLDKIVSAVNKLSSAGT